MRAAFASSPNFANNREGGPLNKGWILAGHGILKFRVSREALRTPGPAAILVDELDAQLILQTASIL
jgi:hypothetical protein